VSPRAGRPPARRLACAAALLLAALLAPACAHTPRGAASPGRGAPAADSATVGLWRLDEVTGSDILDAGPLRLHGTAGLDARPQFGRFNGARRFTRSIDSFVLIPSNPELDGTNGLTVEAWVYLNRYGDYTDTPIALRWAPSANAQSWLFGVVGRSAGTPPPTASGDHVSLIGVGPAGRLVFAFQPVVAGAPRVFFSSRAVPLERWTHVAATYDGQAVRLWIAGLPDAQYVSPGRIAASDAPLMLGNAVDPRALTTFGGSLRADRSTVSYAYYALEGALDELRISNVARRDFPDGRER
jgi:hypothetical protein